MSEAQSTLITKARVKAWKACSSGYSWFLENYKLAEAEFVPVYQHLVRDGRGSDADWLMGKLFPEIGAELRVKLVTQIAGADEKLIAEQHAAGAPGASTEDKANAATTGNWANAATTGNWANAATTGYRANAATTGYRANAATTGEGAVSAVLGQCGKAMAGDGGAIVIAHRDDDGNLLGVKAAMVGQDGIKPDVWYALDEDGAFVEAEES
ncbi:hypothetical protein [Delftia sp. RIT313]|uniref:hypothetical protein n=1 Tax=Delftia sp. RIT313 TaxID=1468410 RepID=UPI0004497AF9|nr:hypothetical protein [Delftia sp. RIT313]EZP51431.1 hypothetical protein BW39_03900 [Delftia sp. RIT313]